MRKCTGVLALLAIITAGCGNEPMPTEVAEQASALDSKTASLEIDDVRVDATDVLAIDARISTGTTLGEEVDITLTKDARSTVVADLDSRTTITVPSKGKGNGKAVGQGRKDLVNINVFLKQTSLAGMKLPFSVKGCKVDPGTDLRTGSTGAISLNCPPRGNSAQAPGMSKGKAKGKMPAATQSNLVDFVIKNADGSPASTVKAGDILSGKLYLNQPAPTGGAKITIYSSNPDALTLPGSVTIPAGSNIGSFSIPVLTTPRATSVMVGAAGAGGFFSRGLEILPHYQGFDLELVSIDDAVMQIEDSGHTNVFESIYFRWGATTRITVRNNGNQYIMGYHVLCTFAGYGDSLGSTTQFNSDIFPFKKKLIPGKPAQVKVYLPLPVKFGPQPGNTLAMTCTASITEPSSDVDQAPANNVRSRTVEYPNLAKPDLVLDKAPKLADCDDFRSYDNVVPARAGDMLCLRLRLFNNEGFMVLPSQDPVTTRCTMSSGNISVSGFKYQEGALMPQMGGYFELYLGPNAEQLAPGTYQVTCTADADQDIAESNEGNNTITGTVTLQAAEATLVY